MTYFVTNVSDTQYTSVAVTIKPKVEEKVDKATYDYLNTAFGASGKFTFRTAEEKTKKVVEKSTSKSPKKASRAKKETTKSIDENIETKK